MQDNSPQLGGQPLPSDSPELPGQRPTCSRCGSVMKPAPVTVYLDGKQPPVTVAWVCYCQDAQVQLVIPDGTLESMGIQPIGLDQDGKPQFQFGITFSYQTNVS